MIEQEDRMSLDDGLREIDAIFDKAETGAITPGIKMFWVVMQPNPDSLPDDFVALQSPEALALMLLGQSAAVGEEGIAEMKPMVFAAHQIDLARDLARRRWNEMCLARDAANPRPI